MIGVVIVDDEPPARKKLARFLEIDPRFRILGEAGDAETAAPLIESLKPDLLFLDIQMPGANGFQLLETLETEPLPRVIFTTAYDQYALAAFEVHALDYLLKPFDRNRFQAAMERAVETLSQTHDNTERMRALLEDMGRQRHYGYARRLLLREGGKIFSLETTTVHAVLAEEKYVRIVTGNREILHRETMKGMETRLDPARFFRIHRSTIINLDHFAHMEPAGKSDYLVMLNNGRTYKLGRNYREAFMKRLEGL